MRVMEDDQTGRWQTIGQIKKGDERSGGDPPLRLSSRLLYRQRL